MLSARSALTSEEDDFLLKVHAGHTQAEAYRRAFKDTRGFDPEDKRGHSRKASELLKQEYMQRALAELSRSAEELALQVYHDQLLTGKGNALLGAAKSIIEQEALKAAKTDQERFWQIAAACGAVVKTTVGEEEVTIPLRDLMPKFKDAVPPQDVQRKTARSLEEWYHKLEEREKELDERERELKRDG